MLPPSPVAGNFWERDGGLLCLALRELGVDCRAVGPAPAPAGPRRPFTAATPAELSAPAWWTESGAHCAVLYSWALPRHTPVIRAARTAGCRLLMRFDSDGLLSPRVHPRLSVLRSYSVFRQRGWPGLAAAPLAAAKELLYGLLPAAYERPMMRHLDHADIIAIESPLAAARVQRLLRHFGRTDLAERVAVVPHGVTSNMSATSAPRKPRIIAVGRWDSHEKDPVLLARTLRLALLANRECDACIVGGGEPLLRRAIHRHAAAVEDRIGILGRQPHDALPSLYREARVLLVTSRYESFHMGAAEALCCGCSVVGPAAIAPLHAFAGHASGTLATDRSPAAMADAVACEMAAWDDGERDATAIGAWACGQFHAGAVARRIVALLNPPTSA